MCLHCHLLTRILLERISIVEIASFRLLVSFSSGKESSDSSQCGGTVSQSFIPNIWVPVGWSKGLPFGVDERAESLVPTALWLSVSSILVDFLKLGYGINTNLCILLSNCNQMSAVQDFDVKSMTYRKLNISLTNEISTWQVHRWQLALLVSSIVIFPSETPFPQELLSRSCFSISDSPLLTLPFLV